MAVSKDDMLAVLPGRQEQQLQLQIKRSQAQLNTVQAQLKSLKKPSANSKAYGGYLKQKAQLELKLRMAQSQLKSLNGKLTTYYTSTGRYEKMLSGETRDAYMAVNALFKNYGLESLAGKIYEYVKNGYSGDTITILLQDTKEYKERFAGNEARVKAGLPVLSPAEYLATENSFSQIMSAAGLPSGFYDQPGDFAGWIGRNTSPSEIQSRVDLATQATVLANPSYRQALNQMGISDNLLTAYFLDPKRSLPNLQKAAATAAVGAGALAQGLTFDKTYAEQLALKGITQEEAAQGYSQIATELGTMRAIGQMYGAGWDQRQSEESVLGGSSEAIRKKTALLSQERGSFSGSAGGARGGLGQASGQK
jgi:hypothetical protein